MPLPAASQRGGGGWDTSMDAQSIARILEVLLERGYRLPIHCAVMGVNGSLIAALFSKTDGEDRFSTSCTAQHFVDEGFVLPVNMLFVDSRGEAMRVLVEADGCAQFMN
jgi:hypothetical protein